MKELTIEAAVENIETVTGFVTAQLEALDCTVKARIQIRIAIDELFGNIAKYAYFPGTGMVTVRFETDDDPPSAVITFIDSGIPFNPLEQPSPDTHLSLELREPGGLGILLVKKTMDLVEYEYKNGQNVLRIRKKI